MADADTDNCLLHTHKSRIISSLKQHIISMVKEIIPLGTQRQTSADGCQSTVLPRLEARSRSCTPAPVLLTPCPTRPTNPTPQEESDSSSAMAPPFTRNASRSDANMLLRSSVNRLSRSARLRGLTPAGIKKQQSSLTNKSDPVRMGPSHNSSSERKRSEASPRKTVHGRRLSFGSPKKDPQEASSSKIDPNSFHSETLQKMLRGGSLLQPRLVLKRLRESDLDSLLDVKRPCLNIDQQAQAQTDKPVNPETKYSLSRTLTPPKPDCTSSNSSPSHKAEETTRPTDPTQPECMGTQKSTDFETSSQLEFRLTHTSTDAQSTQPEHILISPSPNITQAEDKQTHTPIITNSECNLTSSTKAQTASSTSTCTSAETTSPTSNMAHLSTNVINSSSSPVNPKPAGHTPRPLQPSHTFSPTQSTSSLTSTSSSTTQDALGVECGSTHPPASPAPKDSHTPSALQCSSTLTPLHPQTSATTFAPARSSLSLGSEVRRPCAVSHSQTNTLSIHGQPLLPGNTCVQSNPVPRASSLCSPLPVPSLSRVPNSYTPRPLPRLIRQQMSSPIRSPTNLVSQPSHYQTPTNVVSRPAVTPTKSWSVLTKTPIPRRTSRSTDSHTPTKPVSMLTKTPIPTNTVSGITKSFTPAKPPVTLAKTPISTNSVTRPTDSHTPTRSVSTVRNSTSNHASGSSSACTPRPVHPFFQPRQRPVPPVRHLVPNHSTGPADAKQPHASSPPLPAASSQLTPPKYIKCAFMKRGEEGVLMLKEKRSPRVPPSVSLSEPSPPSSSSASSSSSLPAVTGKTTARKLFSEADRQLGPEVSGAVSSSPPSSPVILQQSSPSPFLTRQSPSPPMDNLEEILTPDSLAASAGMDVDMTSPEPSQDWLPHSASNTGTVVAEGTESDETTVMPSEADKVLEEPGHLQSDSRTLKVEPDTNPSQVCSNKDLFRQPQAPAPDASPEVVWIDPLDDLGFDTALDCSLSDTSSSEDEKLLSLQEIMERSVRPPPTPDKEAFSEPNTPVAAKVPVEQVKVKPVHYNNTLDQMLIERKQNEKSKELEEELLRGCREDLLMMEEEEEEVDGEREEEISQEQHQFVQRYTLTASTIRDLHPGEELFSLAGFGRLFTQDSLHLPKGITPRNTAQRCLLRASPKQALLLVQSGLLKMAYASSPCQSEVSRWLLQMMSVHSNPCMSAQILHSLKHLALIAGLKIAEGQHPQFQVWVPRVQDVVLVFLNMGVPFISMFPLEMLQPPFTEADLLGSAVIGPEGVSSGSEHATFPEHNFDNVIKYLSVCAALCPRAYSDQELVLLLALVCRLSLDTHLQLLPTASLSNLMLHLINNITDWDTQMSLVCEALTDLTDDHHNLRRLVQLLPPNSRGRTLRRHLSLSIISKLLNQRCTYKPASPEFQLSDLRRYVPRMTPSVLKKHISGRAHEQDEASLDQQAYYLCYSLLDLTNEASNYEFLRPDQKNQLKLLSAQLEKHVKCDIRESEKCLYRSKVKDYVARIYTRWQVLLQRTRPAQGKLYDFWEPLSEDALSSSQEEQQDQRRPQPYEEVHQRRSQPYEETLQGQGPQEEGQQKQHKDKEPVAEEPEENLAQEEPDDLAAGGSESAEEEMRDDSSGDETVIEDVTMMEEQPEKEEPNGEKNLSKEDEVDQAVEPPTGGEGVVSVQEEGLHGEEETNKRKRPETDKVQVKVEEKTSKGKESEGREEMPVMQDKELAMEKGSAREDGLTAEELVNDKVLAMEEESTTAKGLLEEEEQVGETEMEVELPEEQEQAMEVRVEAGEQQALSSREGLQAEEVEMKETDTESPEDGSNTEVPMAEGEAGQGEGAMEEKRLMNGKQMMGKDTIRAGGEDAVSQLKSMVS